MLNVNNISKSLSGQSILDKVSFCLSGGESIGIHGPNGSGKSTLLNILSCLQEPDSGSVELFGKDLFQSPPGFAHSHIGRSFQASRNLLTMDVSDNLLITGGHNYRSNFFYSLFLKRKTAPLEKGIIELARVIAGDWAIPSDFIFSNQPRELSSFSIGQQKLVELLRLFLHNAKLYLLDEPTESLTRDTCLKLAEYINLLTKKGVSFVIVSHDPEFLKLCTTKIYHLNNWKKLPALFGSNSLHSDVNSGNDSTSPVLEISDLSCKLKDNTILNGVNLTVNRGDIISICGANGSGKSTFLKAVYGERTITQGLLKLNNKPINTVPPYERARLGIIHMFQEKRIFNSLTVEENLKIGHRGHKKELNGKLERVYSHFPILSDHKVRHAGLLSGGQQQILAFGRLLMSNAQVALLDEPFVGVSLEISKEIRAVIKLLSQTGISFLIVDHNIKEALHFSNKFFILSGGQLVNYNEQAIQDKYNRPDRSGNSNR